MIRIVRRGFTLLELLIVIGIIVLLATILLPMLQRVHTQARRTSMAADLEIISQALEAYKAAVATFIVRVADFHKKR